ncbi:MAG TPA: amidohydrolase family protein [Spirochaetia bacterium]|nr:amidohydrolase family protein [Spirochaetia bacterium]
MAAPFQLNDVDRRVYDRSLRDFLPDAFIDIHTHVWRSQDTAPRDPSSYSRVVSWPSRVAADQPVEDLVSSYQLMFPGKSVSALIFSLVYGGDDMDRMNQYVVEASRRSGFPSLLFAHPTWTASTLEDRIRAGGHKGIKVYLNLAASYIPEREIRIFDFLPPHQLDVLARNRWVVMLHIPRDGRLRDPVNLEQMLEIERSWPGARVIIAHVGRAYCDEDLGDAFQKLGRTRDMVFDTSANTNDHVFEAALRAVGPERVLFGSDMPITRMRMRRICEGGRYVNVVPRGLYGDVSGDSHMREADPPQSEELTLFLYEEILAIRRAAERTGLSRADIENVFNRNAKRVLAV